jgi:hypothetical protein
MTAETVHAWSEIAEPHAFARTASATRVHLVNCPHLVGRDAHVVDEIEIATYGLCEWSQDQLDGVGRSHPATLEEAMREQGTPAGAVSLIREHLRFVRYDEIWLPHSRSYVALGRGGRAVAAFGKSYMWVGGRRIDLPGYVDTRHAGHRSQPSYGDTCQGCHIMLPLSGVCDDCD